MDCGGGTRARHALQVERTKSAELGGVNRQQLQQIAYLDEQLLVHQGEIERLVLVLNKTA